MSTHKYLDETGLAQVWGKIKNLASISELSDTDVSSVEDCHILQYNYGESKWENKEPPIYIQTTYYSDDDNFLDSAECLFYELPITFTAIDQLVDTGVVFSLEENLDLYVGGRCLITDYIDPEGFPISNVDGIIGDDNINNNEYFRLGNDFDPYLVYVSKNDGKVYALTTLNSIINTEVTLSCFYQGITDVRYAPNYDRYLVTKQYVDDATDRITDEKLSTSTIGNDVYYPIVGTNTSSATTKYIDSTGFKYDATSSTNGYARLYLGNGTASGTTGSKYGRLMIYGTTAYGVTLDSGSPTENRTISLPNKNGIIALTSDVPTKVSDLTNDSGFITSYTETDPIFTSSVAYGITSSDISNWNSKTSNVGTVTKITAGTGLSGGDITTSGTINHSNSVTAQNTQAIYPIKIDAQGHISEYGSAVIPLTASSTLDATKLSGTVPTACLPSYVDDVLEYSAKSSFPTAGESGKIYVDTGTNLTYRWSGSAYVEISPSLALGTTSSTAFRGDYGNDAYAHAVTNKGSAFTSGLYKITTNSEGHVTAATAVAKADITGLGIPAQDTTYTFDGTYNASSNKAATVSTVTNAVSSKANSSDVLTKTNTTSYTPSGDYNPATKKYVDDVSQPKDLIVTISSEYDLDTDKYIYSADKTFSEVMSAINNNIAVYFVNEGNEFDYSKRAYAFDNTAVYAEFSWGQYSYVYTSSGIESIPDEISMLHPDVYTFIGGDESEVYGGGELSGQATSTHNKGDLLWVKHDVANTINLYIAKENIAVGDQLSTDSTYGNLKQVTIEDCIKNNGLFAITITSTTVNDITTYNADKTFVEITDAYNAGKILIAKVNSSLYQLTTIGSTNCRFMLVNSLSTATITLEYQTFNTLIIDSSNNVTLINSSLFSREGSINTHPKKSLIAAVNGNYNTTPVTGRLTYSDTAYKAYEINDLFWKDNYTLAKATTNIASGGTLTENTNYVSTTISDELKDIRATHLSKTNTTAYTPTADYHPATKKYVDDTAKPKDLMVNITSTWDEDTQSNILTADKTFTEVMTAIENGTLVYFTDEYSEGLPFTTQAYAVGSDYINLDSVNLNRTYVYNSDGTIQELPYTPFLLRPELQNIIGGSDAEAGELTKIYKPAKYSHSKGDLIWLLPDIGTSAFPYLVIDDINAGDILGSNNVYRIYLWDYLKEGNTFVTTVTSTTANDVTTYSADKTFAEITEAYESGKNCIVIKQTSIYVLSLMASTGCCFTNTYANNNFNRTAYETIRISSSDVVTIYNKPFLTTDGTHNVYSNKKLIASVNGNFNTTPVTGSLTYSTTAYKAYNKDDLFWKDNSTLVKATTDIASGGTLIENTNYVSTTISDELKDIRATHLSKTNTTVYTPTADYNPATKKYVDENITPFITTVVATRVNDVTTYSADKTFTEITNAYNDGKDCICKIGNMILELVQMSGSRIIFALAYTNNFDKKLSTVITIQISNSNETTYALKNIATTQYVDEAVSAAGAQSDWNENDTTSSSYIQNRTHYKTSLGYDLHLNLFPYIVSSDELYQETFTIDSETISAYYISEFVFANSDIYDESYFPTNTIDDFDLSLSSSILVVDGVSQTLNHTISRNNSYFGTDVIFAYNNEYVMAITGRSVIVFHSTNTVPTSSLTYDLKLSNEIFEYNTLDKRYLNGELIIKGQGEKSEIFNGLTYEYGFPSKESWGNYSHIEGIASGNIFIDIYLSGQAGATTYSLQYFNFNRYGDVILNKELYAYEDNIEDPQPTGIYITSYSLSDETITLSSTLNADSDISNYNYYLPLPLMYAGENAHAEGKNTYASGYISHAEGDSTTTSGQSSHAEGSFTIASGENSHAEGQNTKASGYSSHAEGNDTVASSNGSHAEGNETTASGSYSHAEGYSTTASGTYSHVEGYYTTAQRRSQHVFGEYNILDTGGSSTYTKGTYIEIVGKGTSSSARSNARTLDWSGNEVLAGKLTVGVAPTNNMDVATKQYVDSAISGASGGSSTLVDLTDTSISSPTNGQVLMYNSTSGKWENTTLPIYNGEVTDYWQGGSY